jgi:transcription initiation factor TFIIB
LVLQNSIISRSLCNNHRITTTDIETGEVICTNCGQVISDKNTESGVYTYARDGSIADKKRITSSRTGMPPSLAWHDKGLSTMIGRADKDASGKELDTAMRSKMNRLRIWDSRISTSSLPSYRNLSHALGILARLKDKLGLSYATVEKTAYIYRKAQKRRLVEGRTISSILAAAIYTSCREMGIPRTLDEVAIACNVTRKELARCYRLLYFELELKIPMVDPMKCIAKIASKVNLSEKTKRQAMNIMYDVIRREISAGKDPMGLAAAVIYMSCKKIGENKRMVDLAQAAGVTEVTIRNRYNELRIKLNKNNNNINNSRKKPIFLQAIGA